MIFNRVKKEHASIQKELKQHVVQYRGVMEDNLDRYEYRKRYIYSIVEFMNHIGFDLYKMETANFESHPELKIYDSLLMVVEDVPYFYMNMSVGFKRMRFEAMYLMVKYFHEFRYKGISDGFFGLEKTGFDYTQNPDLYRWTIELLAPPGSRTGSTFRDEEYFGIPSRHLSYKPPFRLF